jgi:hypothetical protein
LQSLVCALSGLLPLHIPNVPTKCVTVGGSSPFTASRSINWIPAIQVLLYATLCLVILVIAAGVFQILVTFTPVTCAASLAEHVTIALAIQPTT